MRKTQHIVVIMLIGVAFAMQASIDERRESKQRVRKPHNFLNEVSKSKKPSFVQPVEKKVRKRSDRAYHSEDYIADEADIRPLLLDMGVEHKYAIDIDALPKLIESSKTLEKAKSRIQFDSSIEDVDKKVKALNDKHGIIYLYSRAQYIFRESGAPEDLCRKLENEGSDTAKRVYKRIKSGGLKEKIAREERKANGKQKECTDRFNAKIKQQAADNNQEIANKENNNPQLQQVRQIATSVSKPRPTITIFPNVYDPIETPSNVVDYDKEFKKTRYNSIKQNVPEVLVPDKQDLAEILMADMWSEAFSKERFSAIKTFSNTEIK